MMTEFPADKMGSRLSAIGPASDLKLGAMEWQLSGSELALGNVRHWGQADIRIDRRFALQSASPASNLSGSYIQPSLPPIRVHKERQNMKMLPVCLAISILSVTAACTDPADNVPEESSAIAEAEALEGNAALTSNALSAGPNDVADKATVIDGEGSVLREGSNGWTCITETPGMGPMCNDATWMAALGAMQSGGSFPTGKFGVSYMLAGEGNAPGVSNLDPAATKPTEDNMWIKDGPHMMIILPDPSMYSDMSNDVDDPVYVMWKDTPFAHLMVRLGDAESK